MQEPFFQTARCQVDLLARSHPRSLILVLLSIATWVAQVLLPVSSKKGKHLWDLRESFDSFLNFTWICVTKAI